MKAVNWTKEQTQAIETSGNNLLVAAAAGSGKTAVLVERMIHKIVNEKVDIDKILIVTFTNAAASEMRERLLEAIDQEIQKNPTDQRLQRQMTLMSKANICTIDAFCLEVVRNYFYEIGISPNFKIADTTEIELLRLEIIEDLFESKYENQDQEFLQLVDAYTSYLADDALKELILGIDRFMGSSPFPKEWLETKVEEMNLDSDKEVDNDFGTTKWGQVIINQIKEQLQDCSLRLQEAYQEIVGYEELKKYAAVLLEDIQNMNSLEKIRNWDELYYAIHATCFSKWPIDRKVTLDKKEIAKEKRDAVKKEFQKVAEILNGTSKQAYQEIKEMYPKLKTIKKLIFEFEEAFSKSKREKNIADFNDIEHFALDILMTKDEQGNHIPSKVAEKYRNKFIEIAIDEYQDSNLVQEYILTSISNGHNLFMVGDVKQSIYKFRQACPELFLTKYETYQEVEESNREDQGWKIQLFKNFRSRKNILNTTNLVFKEIMSKELGDIDYNEKEYLNLGANFEEVEKPIVASNTKMYIIDNAKQEEEEQEEPIEAIELEAKLVASKIKEMIDSKKMVYDKKEGYRPITYKDIVILLRATKRRAEVFEKELTKLQMPVFSDTSAEYLDSIEIQTMMSLLKVIDNPMQDIPLVTVLRSMIGGFTDNELLTIRLITGKKKSFYQSMKEYYHNEQAKKELAAKIQHFFMTLKEWQEEKEEMSLAELIWKIYIDTGYYDYVSMMPNGLLRQANLKLLFEKAKQYESASFQGLYHFITFIDRLKESSGDLSAAKLIGENENVIRIMSIHKSKGLEFPVVFLSSSHKKFNMQDLKEPILLHQDLGLGVDYIDEKRKLQYSTFSKEALKIAQKEELLSEEMRILYVALTRAKEQLVITGVSKDIEKQLQNKESILKMVTSEKISKAILKKSNSYLDWLELVYLKNKEENILTLEIVPKEQVTQIQEEGQNEEERTLDDLIKILVPEEEKNKIKRELEWEYPLLEASKIEAKTSVSKIKLLETNQETKSSFKVPDFLKEEVSLTGAQKGMVIHLCLQNLIPKKEYSKQDLQVFIDQLRLQKKLSELEYQSISIETLENFVTSMIWEEIKTAKVVEQEKAFYINLLADTIYHNGIEDPVLVQGIIDLYYINQQDELVLVDYKTDYVTTEQELIQKYQVQLQIYKQALESSYGRKVDKVYIYSTHLNKPIEIKS